LTEPGRAKTSSGGFAALPRNVKVLGAVSLVNDIASETIYPLMPQFLLTVLGGNKFHLGLIEGVAESVSSLLKLWAGAWSDRAGRRKAFLIVGYLLTAVFRPLIGLATAPWHLFAARAADRIGKGIRTTPRDALIADSTPPEIRGRAFGFHRAMDHLGAAIGPLLATLFLLAWPDALRPLFLLTVIHGVVLLGLLFLALREAPIETAAKEPPRLTLAPFGRDFRVYLVALVLFTLGNSSDAFLLVRAGELGVPTALLPMLWCVFHVVKSGGNLLAGRAVDRIGPKGLIFGGWLLYAAVYLAFGVANAAWQVWALFLVYAVFYALTEPSEKTLVAEIAGSKNKGVAFGWYNFAIGIAALPSSLLFGWIYERFGSFAAFGWGASLSLAAAALLLTVRAEERS
jgi:MFS family permease